MLLNGTLVNFFLDYKNLHRTREIFKELFETQSQWDQLNNQEIKNLLASHNQLQEEPDNTEISIPMHIILLLSSSKMAMISSPWMI